MHHDKHPHQAQGAGSPAHRGDSPWGLRRRIGIHLVPGLLFALFSMLGAKDALAGAKPEIKLVKSRVEGQAGATAVLTQMAKKQLRSLESCYEKVLKKRPGEVGEVHLEATISPGGRVSAITRSSKTNVTSSLYNCVKTKVRGWRLRPWSPRSRVIAALTFAFRLTATPPRGIVVQGGLTKTLVAGVFTARHKELLSCLSKPPKKNVKLVATVNIAYEGQVKSARVSGRGFNYSARRCMGKKILKWRFPTGRMGHRTYAQYPLLFKRTAHTPSRVRGTTTHRHSSTRTTGTRRPASRWSLPSTRVTVTKVSKKGPLASGLIKRKLTTSWAPSVKSCVAGKIPPGTNVTGRLYLQFTITTKGGTRSRSASFKVKGKAKNKTIRAVRWCAMEKLKGLSFPRSRSRRAKTTSVRAQAKVHAVRPRRSR